MTKSVLALDHEHDLPDLARPCFSPARRDPTKMLHKALLAVVLPMIVALPTTSVDSVLAMKERSGPPARKAKGLPAAATNAGTGSDKGFPFCYYLKCTLTTGIRASGQSCVPDLSGDFCTSPHSVSDGYCYYFKCSKTNGFNAPGQACVVDPDGGMCQRNPVNPDGTWKIAPSPPPFPPPSPSPPLPGTYNLPNGIYSIKGGRYNKFCADEDDQIVCNRDSLKSWEKFKILKLSDSTYSFALIGGQNGKYCADEEKKVICNRNSAGAWEKFRIEQQPDGTYGIKGGRNNQYCSDESSKMICNRNSVGSWGKFNISPA